MGAKGSGARATALRTPTSCAQTKGSAADDTLKRPLSDQQSVSNLARATPQVHHLSPQVAPMP
jgi:hypothetical protein